MIKLIRKAVGIREVFKYYINPVGCCERDEIQSFRQAQLRSMWYFHLTGRQRTKTTTVQPMEYFSTLHCTLTCKHRRARFHNPHKHIVKYKCIELSVVRCNFFRRKSIQFNLRCVWLIFGMHRRITERTKWTCEWCGYWVRVRVTNNTTNTHNIIHW